MIDRDEARFKQNKNSARPFFQPPLPYARPQTALCDALREVKRSLFLVVGLGFVGESNITY